MLIDNADAGRSSRPDAPRFHRGAVHQQRAAVLALESGDDFHERRFARPVLAEQAVNFARAEIHAYVAQRVRRAVGLVERAGAEDDFARPLAGVAADLSVHPGVP